MIPAQSRNTPCSSATPVVHGLLTALPDGWHCRMTIDSAQTLTWVGYMMTKVNITHTHEFGRVCLCSKTVVIGDLAARLRSEDPTLVHVHLKSQSHPVCAWVEPQSSSRYVRAPSCHPRLELRRCKVPVDRLGITPSRLCGLQEFAENIMMRVEMNDHLPE